MKPEFYNDSLRFIGNSGKCANGTLVSDIVRKEFSQRAVRRQQVKEIQDAAVNKLQKPLF